MTHHTCGGTARPVIGGSERLGRRSICPCRGRLVDATRLRRAYRGRSRTESGRSGLWNGWTSVTLQRRGPLRRVRGATATATTTTTTTPSPSPSGAFHDQFLANISHVVGCLDSPQAHFYRRSTSGTSAACASSIATLRCAAHRPSSTPIVEHASKQSCRVRRWKRAIVRLCCKRRSVPPTRQPAHASDRHD